MKQKKEYLKKLDIIRVLSCIMVLLYHFNILKGGFLAVCTFFTLSGYLECMSALKNKDFSIKSYYTKRLKRIYLPLLVVVSISVVLAKLNPSINWINLKKETISVLFGYNNFWQISANLDYFTRNISSPFIHLWYISILMQFDFVFPIAFLLFKKIDEKISKNISTIIVSIVTIISTVLFYHMSKTQSIMIVYYSSLARSFSIFFGILLALIHFKYDFNISRNFKKYNTPIFIIYTIALIAFCIFIPAKTENYAIFMILTTIISMRLIEYSINESNQIYKIDKIIKVLSKISYEIYLVQYPVIFFTQNILINDILKFFSNVLLIFFISLVLHLILFFPFENKKIKRIKFIFLSVIIIVGSFIIIMEKDYTLEMKELEDRLNENSKVIEQKNNEYMNSINVKEDKWNDTLKNIENEENKVAEVVRNLPVIGIGDSVLLGCIDEFYKTFPNGYFDGKVSRTILDSEDILNNLKNKGKLGNTLILSLSNNGDYSEKRNKELIKILENREIYWVNAVGADDPKFNEKFREFANNYPNIHIVEWEKAAKDHPEYFYADGIHVKGSGIKAYVNTIYEAIYNNYLKKYEIEKNNIIQKRKDENKSTITFYGNDILTNAFTQLNKKFDKASFNSKSDYKFESLYNELKNRVANKTLEHNVILLFDKNLNISKEEYQKIIDLCKGYEIYICNATNEDLSFKNENINVIDFYNEIKRHGEYVIADKVHLSEVGNEALANLILKKVENKQ